MQSTKRQNQGKPSRERNQALSGGNIMDWIDLNDWILENHPELHHATLYIADMNIQYECWIKVFNNHIKE